MKHIKTYNSFRLNEELDINIDSAASKNIIEEIQDIFVNLRDFSLSVEDVYSGSALSMKDRDIITDHNDFPIILDSDGKYVGSYKSLSIRLRPESTSSFSLEEELFGELLSAVKHVESQFGLQLKNIYLRTLDGIWFNNVDTMEKYINELPFAKKSSLRHVSYLDLTFRDIDEDIDDSISVKESMNINELRGILDEVKDVLSDLKDEHELDVEFDLGKYAKMNYSREENFVEIDSINIDIKDNKYNFFKFNKIILPVLRRLEFVLQEHNLKIDIDWISENEFFSLERFVKEYGNEEFHEIGIIIY